MSIVSRTQYIKNLLLSKYEPLFCDMLVDHMSKGQSFNSFAGVIKVTIPTIKRWEELHEEFATARELGEALSLTYWEQEATDNANGTKAVKNFDALKFKLKTTHPEEFKDGDKLTLGTDLNFIIDTGIGHIGPKIIEMNDGNEKSLMREAINVKKLQCQKGDLL